MIMTTTTNMLDCVGEKNANLDSNILVSTIHGVKGMEREVVIINSDWGAMCYKAFQSGIPAKEDEETRVCYVGTTSSKTKTNNIYR